jgi:hypothetical protein
LRPLARAAVRRAPKPRALEDPKPAAPRATREHRKNRQDLTEARANVGKRLDYIRGEMGRVDGQLKALQERGAARQQEVRAARSRARGSAGALAHAQAAGAPFRSAWAWPRARARSRARARAAPRMSQRSARSRGL